MLRLDVPGIFTESGGNSDHLDLIVYSLPARNMFFEMYWQK